MFVFIVTVFGFGVGERLLPWSLAMHGRASTWAEGGFIVAYPTGSDISKALGSAVWDAMLFGRVAQAWARGPVALRR